MSNVYINITEEQAAAVSQMLDLSVCIHLCQFFEIELQARFGAIKHRDGNTLDADERDKLRHRLNQVADVFGFTSASSFGIGSEHVSTDAHRAYELKKVLDRALAMHRDPNPQGIKGVNYDGITVRYTDDPAPVVDIRKEPAQ